MIKTYRELRRLLTFEDRYEYLRIGGVIGKESFGFDRYINQNFYISKEWRQIRNRIIVRDNSCDLGIDGRDLFSRVTIHHINPITLDDIENGRECVLDPENLICTSHNTHMAIHYGDISLLQKLPIDRKKGDTCLWK